MQEKGLASGMCTDHPLVTIRLNMPRENLQRPRKGERVAAHREWLEERGRTLMGHANRLALAPRVVRVQILLLMELLIDEPVSIEVLVGVLASAGAVGGGMLRVSTELQTSARRRCCGCEQRQNQTRERCRRG